jgi:hypothetical protein
MSGGLAEKRGRENEKGWLVLQNRSAPFEASLREAPQGEEIRGGHEEKRLILRCLAQQGLEGRISFLPCRDFPLSFFCHTG